MSKNLRLIGILLGILACSTAVQAAKDKLQVVIVDLRGSPIKNVTIHAGFVSTDQTSGPSGRVLIALPEGTKEGTPIQLFLLDTPLVFITPWNGYVNVLSYDNDAAFQTIYLGEPGSKELLLNPDAAKAMLSQVNAKAGSPTVSALLTPEERKQAALNEVGSIFKLKPEEVDKAIRDWGAKANNDHDKGLFEFYNANYEGARIAFSDAKAQRKKELEEAENRYAESAFFEAKSYFRQGKYQEAIASYEEALFHRKNDTAIMSELAEVFQIVGKFEKAEPLLKQALKNNEERYGEYHNETADSVSFLGGFYINSGKREQGALTFERMVRIREKVKGPDASEVAHDLVNLAVAYSGIGRLDDAEKSLKRSLEIIEKNSGKEAPEVAFTLNTIASIYAAKDEDLLAEETLKRSIRILRNAISTSKPDAPGRTKWERNYSQAAEQLGRIYLEHGRIARAAPLLKDALDYREKDGPLRPTEVGNISMLADLNERLGKFAEAEQQRVRALELVQNALGQDHIKLYSPIVGLALLYETRKKFDQAEALRLRMLKIAVATDLESELQVRMGLANFYNRLEKTAQAESQLKQALARVDQATPPPPADLVVRVIHQFATFYERKKRFTEAEPLRRRIFSLLEQQEGKDNPSKMADAHSMMGSFFEIQQKYSQAEESYKRAEDVIRASSNKRVSLIPYLRDRVAMYEQQKRFSEAEALLKSILQIASQPDESVSTEKAATLKISALNSLANYYSRHSRWDDAERSYAEAKQILDNLKDANPQAQIILRLNLGGFLEKKKDYQKAEGIYMELLAIIEKRDGTDHPNAAELRERLAQVGHNLGKNDEAALNYKRALEIFEQELGPEDPRVATCLESYAAFCRNLKREAEAAALEARAKKIRSAQKQIREDGVPTK